MNKNRSKLVACCLCVSSNQRSFIVRGTSVLALNDNIRCAIWSMNSMVLLIFSRSFMIRCIVDRWFGLEDEHEMKSAETERFDLRPTDSNSSLDDEYTGGKTDERMNARQPKKNFHLHWSTSWEWRWLRKWREKRWDTGWIDVCQRSNSSTSLWICPTLIELVAWHFHLQWREQWPEEPFEIHANSTRRSTSGMSGSEQIGTLTSRSIWSILFWNSSMFSA